MAEPTSEIRRLRTKMKLFWIHYYRNKERTPDAMKVRLGDVLLKRGDPDRVRYIVLRGNSYGGVKVYYHVWHPKDKEFKCIWTTITRKELAKRFYVVYDIKLL